MTAQYFVSDVGGSYIKWDSRVDSLSLVERTAIIYGNVGRDWIYVGAGTSVDLTKLGDGADRIYLTGQLHEYTQSIRGNLYTLTRQLGENTETVVSSIQTAADQVYFADGFLSIDTANFFDDSNFTFREIAARDHDSSASTPESLESITNEYSESSAISVYILDPAGGHIPSIKNSDALLEVNGNAGDDSVFVEAGSLVDARSLGFGQDTIYLTGTLESYSQSIIGNTYTLSRIINGKLESVKFAAQSHSDRVVFSDGYIDVNAASLLNGETFEFRELTPDDLDGSFVTPASDVLIPSFLEISADVAVLRAGGTATVTFTFSDVPTGFSAGDIAVSGGELSAPVVSESDPKVYTATFTPAAGSETTASISVGSGTYFDAAGNAGVGATGPTLSIDTQAPSLLITSDVDTLKAGEAATVTFTFSDVPTGFSAGDIAVNGGELSAPVVSESDTKVYTATFTPTAGDEGTATINVGAGTYFDAAGNAGVGATGPTLSIDTQAPSLVITSDVDALKAGETATITFTFNEAPIGFGEEDLAVAGGELSAPVASESDPKVYTATFTPTAGSETTGSVSVSSGSYVDAAGNAGVGATGPTLSIDTQAPSLVITSNVANLKAGETATLTFTFSEAPIGFGEDDLIVIGGELSAPVASESDPKIYTAIFTPTVGSESTGNVSVSSGSYFDAAGNAGVGATGPTLSIDTQAPSLLITSDVDTLKAGEAATVTFTFSEAPTGFSVNDIAVSGGSLGNDFAVSQNDAKVYTVTFTPTANSEGSASISVADNKYTDATGNAGSGAVAPSLTFDTQAPSLVITSDTTSLKAGETAAITFTFSEVPITFIENDVIVSGGLLSGFGPITPGSRVYTATFTPTTHSESDASISVASNTFTDQVGNAGTGFDITLSIDTKAPNTPSLVLNQDTGVSASDSITSDPAILIQNLEIGARWEYRLGASSSWIAGGIAQASESQINLAANEIYAIGAIQVRQTDEAGNQSAIGQNSNVLEIDSTAPVVTEVNITSSGPYEVGEFVEISVTFDSEIFVDTTNGNPEIYLELGFGIYVLASYRGLSEDNTLVFEYSRNSRINYGFSVVANSLHVGGAVIVDAAGHSIRTSHGVAVEALLELREGATIYFSVNTFGIN